MRQVSRRLLFIGAVGLIYVGFRFVTQAGQGIGVIQNDGYAGTGGCLILAGGLVLGILIKISDNEKNHGKH